MLSCEKNPTESSFCKMGNLQKMGSAKALLQAQFDPGAGAMSS
jgi:hypothetical protein